MWQCVLFKRRIRVNKSGRVRLSGRQGLSESGGAGGSPAQGLPEGTVMRWCPGCGAEGGKGKGKDHRTLRMHATGPAEELFMVLDWARLAKLLAWDTRPGQGVGPGWAD